MSAEPETIEFQVPTLRGLVTVTVPADLSARDAGEAAARVAAVIRSMFAVVDGPAPHVQTEDPR